MCAKMKIHPVLSYSLEGSAAVAAAEEQIV